MITEKIKEKIPVECTCRIEICRQKVHFLFLKTEKISERFSCRNENTKKYEKLVKIRKLSVLFCSNLYKFVEKCSIIVSIRMNVGGEWSVADFRQKKRIGDMLLEAGIITQEQLEDALEKNKTAQKK